MTRVKQKIYDSFHSFVCSHARLSGLKAFMQIVPENKDFKFNFNATKAYLDVRGWNLHVPYIAPVLNR